MIVGVFSDVHDHRINLNRTLKIFTKNKVEESFFCGDLVSPFTLKTFQNWPFPVHAVFGNNEGDKLGFLRRITDYKLNLIDYQKSGLTWVGEINRKSIVVFHGHDPHVTNALIKSNQFDFAFTGHTHKPGTQVFNHTTWVNPGSVVGISEDTSLLQGSCAIVDLQTASVIIEAI